MQIWHFTSPYRSRL